MHDPDRRRILAGTLAGSALLARAARGESDFTSERRDKPEEETVSFQKELPASFRADVAVLGGGIAGVCAACAAARSGAKTILVERFAVTGGNLTTGGVGAFCGESRGQGEIFDEVIQGLEAFGAVAPYKPYPKGDARVFDHEILAVVLQELLLRHRVQLLLHTRFVDLCARKRRITHAVVCGKSGLQAIGARQFVDCSGEAEVARAAGFETMKGRDRDGLQLPMSLMFFVRDVKDEAAEPQVPEGWFGNIAAKEDLPMTSLWPNGPGSHALKIKIPGFDSSRTKGLTEAEIQSRRRMMEVLDYYQRVEKKPWRLDHCSPRIGIREGQRIVGDYVLKLEDLRAGRAFSDAVARGVFYLDGHDPTNDKRTYILPKEDRWVPPYQIPFRSLVARDGDNLFMAGRCFSAEQLALSSARVSTTCAMMGQAAGMAAALAADRECASREVDGEELSAMVQSKGAVLDL